jgi:U3 small nucleolar RNA-associated protein 18
MFSAAFLGTTGTVIVSGRRSYFYLYDSVAGKVDEVPRLVGRPEKSLERSFAAPDGRTVAFIGNDGYVLLFDVHNKTIKKTVKLNGSVRSICFQGDDEVLASGSDGDVYRWDMRGGSRLPLERFSNQDGSITSTMAASSRTLAVGSESGVVSLYSEIKGRSKEPLKSIMNIRTPINRVCFNPDGNMLAMSSQMEGDSMKLVHVPTGTVFSNWPTANTPLGYVWSTSFSPGSKFLAIGNDKGKCLLYKLQHYYAASA